MATAIIRSHDCFRDRLGPRSLRYPNPNPNPNPRVNHASRCRRRKRIPSDGNRRSNQDSLSSSPTAKGPVMGQVKILKRGEELKPRMFLGGDGDLEMCSTDRLGPDPEVVQKQIRVPDLYAGSTLLVTSPAPSELPFPAAMVRSRVVESGLRKLLKI